MHPVQWLAKARIKLSIIIEYIAERNDVAAFELLAEIEHVVSQLPQHPYLYRSGRVSGTREIVVHGNYVLVYRVRPTVIEIVTVLHSRQQYPSSAE